MRGGGVLSILIRVSARCHFHKSLNWARLVHDDDDDNEKSRAFPAAKKGL